MNGFKASLGGVLCPQCSQFWERRLSLNALKVLRFLQRSKWTEVARLKLDASLQAELEAVLHSLLRFHLERDLKSWSFLEMLSYKK
jgi:DNA repair protein RecO (recombination protein O)